jgi:hypothetical protein
MALVGWLLMFLAGTDIWHETGRLDLWRLEGPPYPDVRAFVVTFYGLLPVLVAQFVVSVARYRRSWGEYSRPS